MCSVGSRIRGYILYTICHQDKDFLMKLENPNNAIGKTQIVRTASESRLFRYWISDSEISNGNIPEISLYAEIDCVQPIIDMNNTHKLKDMPNYIHTIHYFKKNIHNLQTTLGLCSEG